MNGRWNGFEWPFFVQLKTLKAFPLNSRGSVRPADKEIQSIKHPERVPHLWQWATPLGSMYTEFVLSAGRADLRLLSGDPFRVEIR